MHFQLNDTSLQMHGIILLLLRVASLRAAPKSAYLLTHFLLCADLLFCTKNLGFGIIHTMLP